MVVGMLRGGGRTRRCDERLRSGGRMDWGFLWGLWLTYYDSIGALAGGKIIYFLLLCVVWVRRGCMKNGGLECSTHTQYFHFYNMCSSQDPAQ
jgi:hypothetical protein